MMSSLIGSFRRLLLAPSTAELSFAGRGFPARPSAATAALEAIPRAVACGFEWGVDSPGILDLEQRLDLVEPALRGFAYEGAAMAAVVVDAMELGRRRRTEQLLCGPARQHLFLAYIGIGFAMARLPRRLWPKVMPDLPVSAYHPTMSWLAVDGYGFDLAYFHTGRWVDGQEVPEPYPWEGSPDYFLRAVDQGVGRALWFIHGADPGAVTAAVRAFAEHRWDDLWSGVGLAAAIAGGTDASGLAILRREAGDSAAQLALGAVFAAKARTWAGHVPPHTGTATTVLAGRTVDDAVALADDTAVSPHRTVGDVPAYEVWRQRIRERSAVPQPAPEPVEPALDEA